MMDFLIALEPVALQLAVTISFKALTLLALAGVGILVDRLAFGRWKRNNTHQFSWRRAAVVIAVMLCGTFA